MTVTISASGYLTIKDHDPYTRSYQLDFQNNEQSEGRVDCVIETHEYVYILEFKKDGTAKEAMDQINIKGYAREYEAENRKLYKIGINFSSETGMIDDWLMEER